MRKFLAVVKHEYKKIVLKWTFLIGTLLFPVIAAGICGCSGDDFFYQRRADAHRGR